MIGRIVEGLTRYLRSIRAFDVWGTGVRLIGIRPASEAGRSIATLWLTAFYLPVLPLARRVVQFVEPGVSEARWLTVEATPLRAREVARTYLHGWVLFPLLLVGPFVAGSLIFELTQLPHHGELAGLIRTVGTLVAIVPILLGVPWFAVAIYRLARWDQDRKRPPAT